MLAQEDPREEAKSLLTAGIAAATRVGKCARASEMEGLLAELGQDEFAKIVFLMAGI